MRQPPIYPQPSEIKVEWTTVHIGIVVVSVILIWPLYFLAGGFTGGFEYKFLSLAGLNIDILGVVMASLKTPFYGNFYDGGALEVARQNKERKYFQVGMWLVAAGFLLQALGTALS